MASATWISTIITKSRTDCQKPGNDLTIARKAKNSPNWFIGSITDEQARDMRISLDFLDDDTKYVADIYRDAADAHWKRNPMSYEIDHFIVDNKTILYLHLAEGGGAAVSLMPAEKNQIKELQNY
ncbi:MAG: glycoside hydrolase family 97 C-terminal domain-containing protein [Calditrichaceae bacterium]